MWTDLRKEIEKIRKGFSMTDTQFRPLGLNDWQEIEENIYHGWCDNRLDGSITLSFISGSSGSPLLHSNACVVSLYVRRYPPLLRLLCGRYRFTTATLIGSPLACLFDRRDNSSFSPNLS